MTGRSLPSGRPKPWMFPCSEAEQGCLVGARSSFCWLFQTCGKFLEFLGEEHEPRHATPVDFTGKRVSGSFKMVRRLEDFLSREA